MRNSLIWEAEKMSKVLVAAVSILSIQALLLGVCATHSSIPSPWNHERERRSGAGW